MKIIEDLYWYPKFEPVSHILGRGLGGNVFVLNQGDQIWLFDVGLSIINRSNYVKKSMEKDGLDPQKISKIFLTHAHPDHINAISDFKDGGGPDIYLHHDDLDLFEMDRHEWLKDQVRRIEKYWSVKSITKIFSRLITFFTWWTMGKYPALDRDAVSHPWHKDQTIKGDRYNVQLIHTPGHTAGHAVYYIPEIKAVVSGDTINPRFANKPALNTFNAFSDKYEKTIGLIQNLDLEILCAAHGEKIPTGKEHIQRIVSDAQNYLSNAKKIVYEKIENSGNEGLPIRKLRNILPSDAWTGVDQKITPLVIAMEFIEKRTIYVQNNRLFFP